MQNYSSPQQPRQTQQQIYQVSELNQKVRMMLEAEFVNVWITGEISNLIKASSGHWYFSLKDNKAQIKAAMFRGNNRHVRAAINDGTQVLVRGRISLYEPRGDYQLIVETMEPAGEGLLKQQFEQLKQKLAQMGLFDQDVKRPIPKNPKRVGVVTSPTGAAIHDILTVLKRRSPQTEVVIYPTMVQGNDAARNLIWAINAANYRQEVDVLIVGRGGGSLEDLWSFNDEALAHTIYNSALPIISAVGHEVDVSISDYVADLRAPTPSAAAEIVSVDMEDVLNHQKQLYIRLLNSFKHRQLAARENFKRLQSKLYLLHPSHKIQMAQQRTDELSQKLHMRLSRLISDKRQYQQMLTQRLQSHSPAQNLLMQKQHLETLHNRLNQSYQKGFEGNQQKLGQLVEKLNLVSPLATLQRGYAIATNQHGEVITETKQVNSGEPLNIKVSNGEIKVIVSDDES